VIRLTLLVLISGTCVFAQGYPRVPPPPPPHWGEPHPGPMGPDSRPGPMGPDSRPGPMGPDSHRGPIDRAMHVGPPGRWWDDPQMAQRVGLSQAQQRKMDDVFQQSRPQLIDLNAALQKQEALLDPMLASDPVDDQKVLAQISLVVQARGALEKASSAMLLGLRKVLTAEQWRQLQADDPRNR
jgi:Spy/CpxP family protein refolding chaperone